ncbi:MAG: S10 family peptidase [Haloferula sp.]
MRFTILLLTLALMPLLPAEDKPAPAETKKSEKKPKEPAPPVTKEGSVTIDGKEIGYEVTTSKLVLKKEDGTPRASVFHVSYLKKDVKDLSQRPVMFAFNGGPGSSAVWLHLGMLGPYRIALPGDGTEAPAPPARWVSNEFSILDVADLVFVDPVSTGYSRTEEGGKPSEFHGVQEDISSIADFVRRWVTDNDRWASPKYLLGESYGGVRVAGLSERLQSRYGMSLNGVVLLSSLLDFRTLRGGDGDGLMYSVFLPTYTAVALHHGKLDGDRDALLAKSRKFAFGDYSTALLQGNQLSAEDREDLAKRMSELTSIDPQVLLEANLRLGPSQFRSELLSGEKKVVGRFDARVAWDRHQGRADYASYDPSFSLAFGAYSTAMLAYLSEELGWKEHSPYEILSGKVHPWNWSAKNSIVNLTDELSTAMRDNPHLKVLVMKGLTDLATPPDGIDYSLRQMINLSPEGQKRISHAEYDAGHMFYLNLPDLEKSRKDLVEFIRSAP